MVMISILSKHVLNKVSNATKINSKCYMCVDELVCVDFRGTRKTANTHDL